MHFFSNLWWRCSLYYVDAFEKEVDRFLCDIQNLTNYEVREKVLRFMQQDFVRFSVYLEWKFKGYAQLRKSKRRLLYKNADLIHADFQHFCKKNKVNVQKKECLVQALQKYLSPNNKFSYKESTAFFGLLKNPHKEKLVGDCNQICSLYVALSAPYFLSTEWKIHLYDGHVALVFEGKEVEATNGATKPLGKGGAVLPIENLVSVNILDISEKNRTQFDILPERFLQSASLVESLSPHNPLAKKNMQAALYNMALDLMKHNKFSVALRYFTRLKNQSAVQNLYVKAVQYYLDCENISKAEKWADKSGDISLNQVVWSARGRQYLKQKKYRDAQKYFEKSHQPENVKIVLEVEMFAWYESVKNITKLSALKTKKSLIQKIHARAKYIGHDDMVFWCKSVLEQL